MPQLDPTSFSSQLFWLMVTFGLLYVIILKFVLPEIGKVLRQRQDRVQSDLEQAEKLKEEAFSLKNEYEASLQTTREQAKALVLMTINEATDKAQLRYGDLDNILVQKMSEAEHSIEDMRKKAVDKFTPFAVQLTQHMVKKLVNINVEDDKATECTEKLMKGIQYDI